MWLLSLFGFWCEITIKPCPCVFFISLCPLCFYLKFKTNLLNVLTLLCRCPIWGFEEVPPHVDLHLEIMLSIARHNFDAWNLPLGCCVTIFSFFVDIFCFLRGRLKLPNTVKLVDFVFLFFYLVVANEQTIFHYQASKKFHLQYLFMYRCVWNSIPMPY